MLVVTVFVKATDVLSAPKRGQMVPWTRSSRDIIPLECFAVAWILQPGGLLTPGACNNVWIYGGHNTPIVRCYQSLISGPFLNVEMHDHDKNLDFQAQYFLAVTNGCRSVMNIRRSEMNQPWFTYTELLFGPACNHPIGSDPEESNTCEYLLCQFRPHHDSSLVYAEGIHWRN